nr:reverse transcriptase domain-containing protein [Tanacetum cinerariifolium]
MSTRSSARNLFPPLDNPELTIRRRSCTDPTLLNNSKMTAEGNSDLPVPDLRTKEELCQPSLNGRGGPIAPIAIQETNFGLKNDMIQQVQNSCQFHGLPGDDANKHLDKFLHVTQSIKVNGVTDDALRLYLFPHSLTHHATAWFDPLKAEMAKINKNLMRVLQVNQQVKAVTPNCETCGGPHSFSDCPATVGNTQNVYAAGAYQVHEDEIASSLGSGTLSGNTITNPKEDLKGITTRRGTAYPRPTIPTTSSSPVVERETEETKDTVHTTNNRITEDVQPLVVPTEFPILNSEPVNSPIIEPVASPVVLLKKLPEKLGEPDKFLIPCDFSRMAECLALADLGASINLMPLSVWNKLPLLDLSHMCMTLELADRSISRPVGVAEDVYAKVGTFHFPTDFVVVYFDADPRVPIILEKSFLKIGRALKDM